MERKKFFIGKSAYNNFIIWRVRHFDSSTYLMKTTMNEMK